MKRVLTGLGAALLLSTTAMAADMSPAAPYDWSGAYIGLQAGYGWGNYDLLVPPTKFHDNVDGILGGIYAGYLFQQSNVVFGAEADVQGTGLSGKIEGAPGNFADLDLNLESSLRARAGVAMGRVLVYATGGLALGDIDFTTRNPGAKDSRSNMYVGYTVGGGLEYAITDNVSTRIEYRYTDLGSHTFGSKVFPADTFKAGLAYHTVEAGVTWHF